MKRTSFLWENEQRHELETSSGEGMADNARLSPVRLDCHNRPKRRLARCTDSFRAALWVGLVVALHILGKKNDRDGENNHQREASFTSQV